MTLWEMLGCGFILCGIILLVAWIVAARIYYYSLVDVVWAYGIGVLVIFYAAISDGSSIKKMVGVFMAALWSMRLGTYLMLRLKRYYPAEDTRYSTLKAKWSRVGFLLFFEFQAVSQVLFCLPFLFLVNDQQSKISVLTLCGLLTFLLAFAGENLADWQLNNFRRNPENNGKVCEVGLWRYSRHPNYFFEWLIWCGIAITALGSPYGIIGLISPILMFLTLNYVTGVPAAEEQSLHSRGDLYRSYQKRTNRFFLGCRNEITFQHSSFGDTRE